MTVQDQSKFRVAADHLASNLATLNNAVAEGSYDLALQMLSGIHAEADRAAQAVHALYADAKAQRARESGTVIDTKDVERTNAQARLIPAGYSTVLTNGRAVTLDCAAGEYDDRGYRRYDVTVGDQQRTWSAIRVVNVFLQDYADRQAEITARATGSREASHTFDRVTFGEDGERIVDVLAVGSWKREG